MTWFFPGLIFLSLLVMGLAFRTIIFGRQESHGEAMKRRLMFVNAPKEVTETAIRTLLRDGSLSTIPLLHRLLARLPKTADLQLLLRQAGDPFNVGTLVLLSATLAAIGLVIGIAQGSAFLAFLLLILGAVVPIFWLRMMKNRRLKAFEEQFPEAVELMARALRAGHAFSASLGMVADELEDPVAGEFAKTFEDYSYGKSLSDALSDLVDRVGLQDLKFFVTAVNLQRETGGNLAEIMDNIGYIIRERFRLQRHVRALSAEGRLSGTILSLIPPVLLLILWTSSPDYVATLFTDPKGKLMLLVAGVFQLAGMLVIKRLVSMKI